MDNVQIVEEDVFKNLNISKYDLYEFNTDYNKFCLRDFTKIIQIIKNKIDNIDNKEKKK